MLPKIKVLKELASPEHDNGSPVLTDRVEEVDMNALSKLSAFVENNEREEVNRNEREIAALLGVQNIEDLEPQMSGVSPDVIRDLKVLSGLATKMVG